MSNHNKGFRSDCEAWAEPLRAAKLASGTLDKIFKGETGVLLRYIVTLAKALGFQVSVVFTQKE